MDEGLESGDTAEALPFDPQDAPLLDKTRTCFGFVSSEETREVQGRFHRERLCETQLEGNALRGGCQRERFPLLFSSFGRNAFPNHYFCLHENANGSRLRQYAALRIPYFDDAPRWIEWSKKAYGNNKKNRFAELETVLLFALAAKRLLQGVPKPNAAYSTQETARVG